MRRAIPILAMALIFTLAAEAAWATVVGGLTVELSRSRHVLLPGAASTISIADPSVVDVAVLDSHSIVVVGKAYGVTDVIITDHSGRLLMDGRVSVVPLNTQHLTVIRGETPTDYVCVGRCSPAVAGATNPATDMAQAMSSLFGAAASASQAASTTASPVTTTMSRSPP